MAHIPWQPILLVDFCRFLSTREWYVRFWLFLVSFFLTTNNLYSVSCYFKWLSPYFSGREVSVFCSKTKRFQRTRSKSKWCARADLLFVSHSCFVWHLHLRSRIFIAILPESFQHRPVYCNARESVNFSCCSIFVWVCVVWRARAIFVCARAGCVTQFNGRISYSTFRFNVDRICLVNIRRRHSICTVLLLVFAVWAD